MSTFFAMLANALGSHRQHLGLSIRLAILVGLFPCTATQALAAQYLINPESSFVQIAPGVFDDTGEAVAGTYLLRSYGIAGYGYTSGNHSSLRNSLTGTFNAAVSGNSITFSGGSSLDIPLHTLSPFSPAVGSGYTLGSEDNFGGFGLFSTGYAVYEDGFAAVRDVSLFFDGGVVNLNSPATNLGFRMASGVLDYELAGYTPDSIDLLEYVTDMQNASTAPVTLTGSTLSIPIHFVLNFDFSGDGTNDSRIEISGLIVANRFSIPGDFNGDGRVDHLDLLKWQDDYGPDGGSDADGDGDSDGRDFLIWQRNYGMGAPLLASIPEPTTATLALLMMCLPLKRMAKLRYERV